MCGTNAANAAGRLNYEVSEQLRPGCPGSAQELCWLSLSLIFVIALPPFYPLKVQSISLKPESISLGLTYHILVTYQLPDPSILSFTANRQCSKCQGVKLTQTLSSPMTYAPWTDRSRESLTEAKEFASALALQVPFSEGVRALPITIKSSYSPDKILLDGNSLLISRSSRKC